MHLAHYLGLLHRAQINLADAFGEVGAAHADEPDVEHLCRKLADDCREHAARLAQFAERYGDEAPDRAWTLVGQAAQGARDRELLATVERCEAETSVQLKWLRTRMKEAAPQALVVAR